jgi:predicted Fe-Mo cluster-binding NifX family protein
MSCYFRHIKDILEEAGIEVNSANKKKIDQAIHQLMGVDYKDCSATWKRLKQEIMIDEQKRQDFIKKLEGTITA